MNSDVMPIPSYKEDLKTLIQQLGEMLPEQQFSVFNDDAGQLARRHDDPLRLERGDKAPLFSLPNASGKAVAIADLLKQGPVVLTFYRGAWCPYCNLQLKSYQAILPRIKAAGASLVAVSPMTADYSLSMKETNELGFEVLSDVGNQVARQYTQVFNNGEAPIQAMTELGYDFSRFYGDGSNELPVPATFVITQEGGIVFAESGGGYYRERVEPMAILEVLDSLSELTPVAIS